MSDLKRFQREVSDFPHCCLVCTSKCGEKCLKDFNNVNPVECCHEFEVIEINDRTYTDQLKEVKTKAPRVWKDKVKKRRVKGKMAKVSRKGNRHG